MTILESALAEAGSLRDRQRRCSPRGRRGRDSSALEIAADEPQDLGCGIAKRRAVTCDRPREHVIDHHGRNGGRKPESGRQQRLGDAWRNHRKVGGMRFRDAERPYVRPIIKEIQASGVRSMRGIARALTARGVKTARGGDWSDAQVAAILRR